MPPRKKNVVAFQLDGAGSGVRQTIGVKGSPNYVMEVDAYPSFGGEDAHPSPLSYALAGLISCGQVVAQLAAKDLGVRVGRFEWSVVADLDTAVIGAGAEGNANFDNARIAATIETDATPEQFDVLKSETERRCPVFQMFERSGLELSSVWTATALDREPAAV